MGKALSGCQAAGSGAAYIGRLALLAGAAAMLLGLGCALAAESAEPPSAGSSAGAPKTGPSPASAAPTTGSSAGAPKTTASPALPPRNPAPSGEKPQILIGPSRVTLVSGKTIDGIAVLRDRDQVRVVLEDGTEIKLDPAKVAAVVALADLEPVEEVPPAAAGAPGKRGSSAKKVATGGGKGARGKSVPLGTSVPSSTGAPSGTGLPSGRSAPSGTSVPPGAGAASASGGVSAGKSSPMGPGAPKAQVERARTASAGLAGAAKQPGRSGGEEQKDPIAKGASPEKDSAWGGGGGSGAVKSPAESGEADGAEDLDEVFDLALRDADRKVRRGEISATLDDRSGASGDEAEGKQAAGDAFSAAGQEAEAGGGEDGARSLGAEVGPQAAGTGAGSGARAGAAGLNRAILGGRDGAGASGEAPEGCKAGDDCEQAAIPKPKPEDYDALVPVIHPGFRVVGSSSKLVGYGETPPPPPDFPRPMAPTTSLRTSIWRPKEGFGAQARWPERLPPATSFNNALSGWGPPVTSLGPSWWNPPPVKWPGSTFPPFWQPSDGFARKQEQLSGEKPK